MKQIITFILIILSSCTLVAQNLLKEASDAYSKGDYPHAVDLYEQALVEQGEAAELYYNLGNSYYKADNIAKAILNYERALLLSPNFVDARFNLEITQQRVVDKIEPVGSFFLSQWSDTLRERFSSDGWANLAIISFLLFIGGLTLYFFTNRIWTKKTGFFGAIFFLTLCIIANNYSAAQKNKYLNRNRAVVFAPSVSIKSTPDQNGTDLFILHEGTTVEIKSKLGSWTEIELADGNVGWIEQNKIEII